MNKLMVNLLCEVISLNKISLVMIVKNEERCLDRCLKSIRGTVDEIIIVDTGSTDKTLDIAKKHGANIYHLEWNHDFAKARNYAISKATGDWLLSLDADEYLRKNYRATLQNHIQKGQRIGKIKITSKFENEDGAVQEAQVFISRFFPKGVQYTGKIHEQLNTHLPRVNMNIEVLHDGYYKTDKTERNISILKEELKITPKDSYYLYQLGKEYRNRKEYKRALCLFELSYNYVNKREGYYYSVVVEYLNTLIKLKKYKKGIQFIKAEEKAMGKHPDFYFSKGTLLLEYYSSLPSATYENINEIEKAFLKCLQIGDTNQYESVRGTGSFLAAYNLGILYELCGTIKKAKFYYQSATKQGYQPAKERMKSLC